VLCAEICSAPKFAAPKFAVRRNLDQFGKFRRHAIYSKFRTQFIAKFSVRLLH